MKSSILTPRLFICGMILWIVPFVLAIPFFQFFGSNRIVFKSIMGVILAITVVLVWNFYLKKIHSEFLKHSYVASCVWVLMSIVPDLFAFIGGFQMEIQTYLSEIAISYLVIPVILIGSASALENSANR